MPLNILFVFICKVRQKLIYVIYITSPVSVESILSSNYLKILKLDGTTPLAAPECTPSSNT